MDALHVVFRHMDPSPAVEARIRTHVERLEHLYGRITTGQVVVEAPHRRNRQGRLFAVRLRLSTPGRHVVVTHEGRLNHAHEDIYVALRDAFDAAARQLDAHAERLRGEIKTHAAPLLTGKVSRLFPDHGFVTTAEGLEIYFHANSVSGKRFARMVEGDEVRLAIAEGESPDGPQATTVLPRRRRNAAIAAD
jgi:ribosome-associated translation inhibitor RaiA/cold shock CspA family protein